jgi:anti-sigma regulatory factor (Ser/Thr protein kinase)
VKLAMGYTVQFPHHLDSIPAARGALDRLRDVLDDVTMRNARLLVSELVTNVIRHVPKTPESDEIELSVEHREGRLRVEVADHGQGFVPAPRVDQQDSASGWGLHILAQVASRWGVESDGGTRVWFELEAPTGAPDRSRSQATAA